MDANAHMAAGTAYYKDGNYKLAIECFLLATEADSKHPDHFEQLGIARFHHGDKEGALTALHRAQELQPENPYRYSSRAYVRDSLGDTAGAVEDYRIAVKLDPEDAVAWNNLGLLEEKLGYKQLNKSFFDTLHLQVADQAKLRNAATAHEVNLRYFENGNVAVFDIKQIGS